MGERCCWPKWS